MQVDKPHLNEATLSPSSILMMARMALPSQRDQVSKFSTQLISVLAFYFPYCLQYVFPSQLEALLLQLNLIRLGMHQSLST